MNDPMPAWDRKVEKTLDSVHREAKALMWLGFVVYGVGSAAILYTMQSQPGLATAAVMYLFQLLVLFFGTRKMYPAISGGFRIGLEANRSSMPLFEKASNAIENLEKNPESHPALKTVSARIDAALDAKISPVIERWNRIGERVEKVLLPKLEKAIEDASESVRKLDVKTSSTLEGIKRVQQKVEGEIDTGMFKELREGAQAVKLLAAPHAPAPMPAFQDVLASLGSPRNGAAVPVTPQGGKA